MDDGDNLTRNANSLSLAEAVRSASEGGRSMEKTQWTRRLSTRLTLVAVVLLGVSAIVAGVSL